MIDIKDLSKNYRQGLKVLDNISISIRENEFVSLIGPSGCGKTTLLKIIAGLEFPSSGNISVMNMTCDEARRLRIFGFLFQSPVLFNWRTVEENIMLPADVIKNETIMSRKEWEARCNNLVEIVGLRGFERAYPSQLSGGMRARVAIARTYMYRPKILLMDEPFSSLDDISRLQMNCELLRIFEQERTTVVFVTHSIEEAVMLSDRIAVMSHRPSRIVEQLRINVPRSKRFETYNSEKLYQYQMVLRELLRLGYAESGY